MTTVFSPSVNWAVPPALAAEEMDWPMPSASEDENTSTRIRLGCCLSRACLTASLHITRTTPPGTGWPGSSGQVRLQARTMGLPNAAHDGDLVHALALDGVEHLVDVEAPGRERHAPAAEDSTMSWVEAGAVHQRAGGQADRAGLLHLVAHHLGSARRPPGTGGSSATPAPGTGRPGATSRPWACRWCRPCRSSSGGRRCGPRGDDPLVVTVAAAS